MAGAAFDTSKLKPFVPGVTPTATPGLGPSQSGGFDTSKLRPIQPDDQIAQPAPTTTQTAGGGSNTPSDLAGEYGKGLITGIPHMVEYGLDEIAHHPELGPVAPFLGPVADAFGQTGIPVPEEQLPSSMIKKVFDVDKAVAPPTTDAGRLARAAGEGSVTMLIPGGGEIKGPLSFIRALLEGGVGGAAAQGATDIVPDQFKPAAALVGGIGGAMLTHSGIGLAAGTGRFAKNYVAPLTAGGRDKIAAKRYAGMFEDPEKAKTDLAAKVGKEDVPGSRLTTGQMTGDLGALSAEGAFARENDVPFNARKAEQNRARTSAIEGVTPDAEPQSLVELHRKQREALDQQLMEAEDKGRANLNEHKEAIAGPGGPLAAQGLRGGLRASLQSTQKARRALWKPINESNASVKAGPIKAVFDKVYGDLPPEAELSAGEVALKKLVGTYGEWLPLQRLSALRVRINDEMRAANTGQPNNQSAFARLKQVREAVDDAIDETVQQKIAEDDQAVQAGSLAPEAALGERLKQQVGEHEAALGVGRRGVESDAAAAQVADTGADGAAGEAGRGPVGAEGIPGVQEAPRGTEPPKRAESTVERSPLHQEMSRRFQAAGRPKAEADALAQVNEAIYGAMSKHTGQTPEQLLAKYPLPGVEKAEHAPAGALHQSDTYHPVTAYIDKFPGGRMTLWPSRLSEILEKALEIDPDPDHVWSVIENTPALLAAAMHLATNRLGWDRRNLASAGRVSEIMKRAVNELTPTEADWQAQRDRLANAPSPPSPPSPETPTVEPFYSAVGKAVMASKSTKATPEQWLATLKNAPGIKQEELDWLGLEPWLKEHKGPVSKDEVADYVRANSINVEETLLTGDGDADLEFNMNDWEQVDPDPDHIRELAQPGEWAHDQAKEKIAQERDLDPDFIDDDDPEVMEKAEEIAERDERINSPEYTASATYGGVDFSLNMDPENHVSIYDATNNTQVADRVRRNLIRDEIEEYARETLGITKGETKFYSYADSGGEDYSELLLTIPNNKGGDFHNAHWDDPHTVAHVRFDTRDVGGKRTLFLQEVQSDWHQHGETHGYEGEHRVRKVARAEAAHAEAKEAYDTAEKQIFLDLTEGTANNLEEFRDYLEQKYPGTYGRSMLASNTDSPERNTLVTQFRKKLDALQEGQETQDLSKAQRKLDTIQSRPPAPDAPFKTTWTDLSIKRMIRWAAEHGYEQVAWTPGDLENGGIVTHEVSDVAYAKTPDGNFLVSDHYSTKKYTMKELRKKYGPLADQIEAGEGEVKDHSRSTESRQYGLPDGTPINVVKPKTPVRVGGKLQYSYGDVLPSITQKIVKKYGSEVGRTPMMMQGQRLQAVTVPITQELRNAALHQGFPLFQRGQRGAIRLGRDGVAAIISMLKHADASTGLHELGHHYLDMFKGMAEQKGSALALRNDWNAVKNWWKDNAKRVARDSGNKDVTPEHVRQVIETGTTGDSALDAAVDRGFHEQWARAFERYMREGVAPTPGLKGAFERFKDWLTGIYHSVKQLNVKLSPEMRGVFDRMLGGDEEGPRASPQQDRYVGGLSTQQSMENQGRDFVPSNKDMAALESRLTEAGNGGGASVRAQSTEGRYGAPERSVDLEVNAPPTYDPHPLWNRMVQEAHDARQDSVFFGREIPAGNVDTLRHRPGVEIRFDSPKAGAALEAELAKLKENGVEFYTLTTKGEPVEPGAMPAAGGVRILYMPEFDRRYGGAQELSQLDDAALGDHMKAKHNEMAELVDRLAKSMPGTTGRASWFDTKVAFSHQYPEIINGRGKSTGTLEGDGRTPAGQKRWHGNPVRQGLEEADRQLRFREQGADTTDVRADRGNAGPAAQEQPVTPLDKGTAKQLATAVGASKAEKQTFGAEPVRSILRPEPKAIPDSSVLSRSWRKGVQGGEAVSAILKADPKAGEALSDVAAASLADLGELTPTKLKKWRADHDEALSALYGATPGLRKKLSNVEGALDHIANLAAIRKDEMETFDTKALAKVAGLNSSKDVSTTVGGMLGKKDSVKRMAELAASTANDPPARAGLQRALLEHLMSKLKGTDADETIKNGVFQNYLTQNLEALREVLDPEQINMLTRVAKELKSVAKNLQVSPGSPTKQYLAAGERYRVDHPSILRQLLVDLGVGSVGWLHSPLAAAGSAALSQLAQSARSAGLSRVDQLIVEAMLNPEIGLAMLKKAPKKRGSGAEFSLIKSLGRIGGFATLNAAKYAAGGRVGYMDGGGPRSTNIEDRRGEYDRMLQMKILNDPMFGRVNWPEPLEGMITAPEGTLTEAQFNDLMGQEDAWWAEQQAAYAHQNRTREAGYAVGPNLTGAATQGVVPDGAGGLKIIDLTNGGQTAAGRNIPANPYANVKRPGDILGIVFHHSGGSGLEGAMTAGQKAGIQKGTGAQYYVDRDGTIYQYAPDTSVMNNIRSTKYRTDAGQPTSVLNNNNVIGVEFIAPDSEHLTDAQLQAAAAFSKQKMAQYPTIQKQFLVGHGQLQGGKGGNKLPTEGVPIAQYVSKSLALVPPGSIPNAPLAASNGTNAIQKAMGLVPGTQPLSYGPAGSLAGTATPAGKVMGKDVTIPPQVKPAPSKAGQGLIDASFSAVTGRYGQPDVNALYQGIYPPKSATPTPTPYQAAVEKLKGIMPEVKPQSAASIDMVHKPGAPVPATMSTAMAANRNQMPVTTKYGPNPLGPASVIKPLGPLGVATPVVPAKAMAVAPGKAVSVPPAGLIKATTPGSWANPYSKPMLPLVIDPSPQVSPLDNAVSPGYQPRQPFDVNAGMSPVPNVIRKAPNVGLHSGVAYGPYLPPKKPTVSLVPGYNVVKQPGPLLGAGPSNLAENNKKLASYALAVANNKATVANGPAQSLSGDHGPSGLINANYI